MQFQLCRFYCSVSIRQGVSFFLLNKGSLPKKQAPKDNIYKLKKETRKRGEKQPKLSKN